MNIYFSDYNYLHHKCSILEDSYVINTCHFKTLAEIISHKLQAKNGVNNSQLHLFMLILINAIAVLSLPAIQVSVLSTGAAPSLLAIQVCAPILIQGSSVYIS